ncbi:MAG: hypothetical protein ACI9AD_000294 [Nitriliruptoraceae bacterium]|jgi:hypothetical protein
MAEDPHAPTRYVLVHGAGGSAWEWHRVTPLLESLGHEVVVVELPCDDEAAGLQASADVIVTACGVPPGTKVVVVAQSFAGVTAPIACARTRVDLLILLCAMTPAPGERAADWWDNVAASATGRAAVADGGRREHLPDVGEAAEAHRRRQVAAPVFEPWPLDAWPDVRTAFILGIRDRFFSPAMQRRVAADRLGLVAYELDAGHLPAVSEPAALVAVLERARRDGGAWVSPSSSAASGHR